MNWKVNKEGVSYKLNDDYTLFITMEHNGLKLKTYEMKKNGKKHKLMYVEHIGNNQLGHLFPINKEKNKWE